VTVDDGFSAAFILSLNSLPLGSREDSAAGPTRRR
jgi:hypothetical protein